MRILAIKELDREAVFLSSKIVELETLPQPVVNNFPKQVDFLRKFFAQAELIECTSEIQESALTEACKGAAALTAADALHVACAMAGGATELVCAELPEKPLPKAVGVPVRSLYI